nr:unnamed protein product [Digitaria exilis]
MPAYGGVPGFEALTFEPCNRRASLRWPGAGRSHHRAPMNRPLFTSPAGLASHIPETGAQNHMFKIKMDSSSQTCAPKIPGSAPLHMVFNLLILRSACATSYTVQPCKCRGDQIKSLSVEMQCHWPADTKRAGRFTVNSTGGIGTDA